MNNIKKIAICGKQNTGKNTLANIIIKLVCGKNISQTNTHIIAFADPIKEMICKMFPKANKDYLWGSSAARNNIIPDAFNIDGKPLTYRQALIDIGTLGRKYNKDTWVNVFDDRLTQLVSKSLIICPDVRFVNEYSYLKKENFIVVKITRDNVVKSTDATETEQDGIKDEQFDLILKNNSSIDDLQAQATEIIRLLE